MDSYQDLPRPFFVLAPMDAVTDTVFRRIVASNAPPDLYFTEFANVDGLQSAGRERVGKKLQFTPAETPLVAHIWGKNPENFYQTAQELAGKGYAGIDLNMGCPDKTVVKNGVCSALMNNRELAVEIIKATQEGAAGRLPVSVKTRLGFNKQDESWPALLLQQKLNMLTIHGRTRAEMSKVPADWEAIGRIRELRDQLAPDTLIVGNGDVESRAQGLELAEKYHLDGIMIGRGVFHDPFVFAQNSPWEDYTVQERIALYRRHIELFRETWRHGEYPIYVLNKFCKTYINGFDGAKEMRETLMSATSADDLLKKLDECMVGADA